MSAINLEKIDKFYLGLTAILILMSILVIFTFRGVFSMFLKANEIDQNSFGPAVIVNKAKLEEAYNFVYKKNLVHLQQIPEVAPITAKKE